MPVLWTPPLTAEPVQALLMFRVGTADETYLTNGITSAVAYRAGVPVVRGDAVNVGQVTTAFFVTGDPADVAERLADITDRLAHLPTDELTTLFKDLLRGYEHRWPANRVEDIRYGPQTFGLFGHFEAGLCRLTAADLTDWARTRFTATNAVLCWVGDAPDAPDVGLRLGLLPGGGPGSGPIAPPPSTPLPHRYPAWGTERAVGIGTGQALGMLLTPDAASETFLRALELRTRVLAESDDVDHSFDRIGADVAHGYLSVYSWNTPEADGMAAALHDIAHSPLPPSQLPLAPLEEPFEWLERSAQELLLGIEPGSRQDRLDAAAAVTPEDVRRVAAAALDTALFALHEGAEITDPRVRRLPRTSDAAVVGGRIFRSAEKGSDDTLLIADDGASLVTDEGPRTVRFADLTGVLVTARGDRRLVSRDGLGFTVSAEDWHDGRAALRLLDSRVDPGLVVQVPDYFPRPRRRRHWPDLSRLASLPEDIARVGLTLAVLVLDVGALASLQPAWILLMATLTMLLYRAWARRLRGGHGGR